ncbi:MAG: SipW-dependent-type signal peptide-containing protein, partial [Clostridiales bacterium]|nr:SipW-dependent-type signal peptide-containing protein [Clostridiales bacterium]
MEKKKLSKKSKRSMKKTVLAVVGILSVGILVVGGTLAYLTDTAVTANTFAIGDVDIDNVEKEWDKYINRSDVDVTLIGEEKIPVVIPSSIIPKDPSVVNTGKVDAYIRTQIRIPAVRIDNGNYVPLFIPGFSEDEDADFAAAYNDGDWSAYWGSTAVNNFEEFFTQEFTAPLWQDAAGDGKYYYVFDFYYNKVLEAKDPDEETSPIFNRVQVNPALTDPHDYEGYNFKQISVYSEALQSTLPAAATVGDDTNNAYKAFAFVQAKQDIIGNNRSHSFIELDDAATLFFGTLNTYFADNSTVPFASVVYT